MTLFHFGNCLALAYAPYFMTYKFSGLSEYGAFWKCIQAGVMYLVTQLCKMMILATFFPTGEHPPGSAVDTVSEFLKSTVDIADLVGLHFIMTKISGKGETKFLVAGLGWASAELLVTRFIPLWVGARGVEFDWRYLQLSFDSNISLVHHIATATLMWLWSRHDLRKIHMPVVVFLLAVCCYRPLVIEFLSHVLGLGPWSVLFIKASATVTVGMIALNLYLSVTQSMNVY